jgi:hypothetical protein
VEDRPQAPRWIGPVGGLLFFLAALLLQFLAGLADGWFTRLGAFAFTGMLFDMLMIFLAAFAAASPFVYRIGCGPAVRRRLIRAFVVAYGLWTAFSFLVVVNRYQFAPVLLGLVVFSLVEVATGAVLILLAVYLCTRLLEPVHARRLQTRRDEAAAIS